MEIKLTVASLVVRMYEQRLILLVFEGFLKRIENEHSSFPKLFQLLLSVVVKSKIKKTQSRS